MTEDEWLACIDPPKMLEFLRGKAGARKLRLFACACCRRLQLSEDSPAMHIVEAAERHADGLAGRKELQLMSSKLGARGGYSSAWALNNALHSVLHVQAQEAAQGASAFCGDYAYFRLIERVAGTSPGDQQKTVNAKRDEQEKQTILLRDIVGNPFWLPAVSPAWRTWSNGTVEKLAQCIYDERTFNRLPLLADALEDAGCADAEILGHLRSPKPHVRGCWPLDLLIGSS